MGSSSPPSGGFVPDLATCRLMSLNEKRELVRELSKYHLSAPEQLQEWTRREISEVLCAELGRERKEKTFSSISKHNMLDILFKVVKGESNYPSKYRKRKSNPDLNRVNLSFPSRRQRKNGSSSLLAVMARTTALTDVSAVPKNAHLCQNSACRATINPGDEFCKRCSCCICFKYDDNKDPTLWLSCNSDQPLQDGSCGFCCHLECALEDKRSGIQQSGQSKKLDGDYYCTQCGKQNDLLRSWEKQLLVAKNARRLDVLCHRIFLSHKILISTKKYSVLHNIVDTAVKKLEAEFGPITGTRDMGHGLVGRLAVGAEVQKLCTCAIEAVQSLLIKRSLLMYNRGTLKQNLKIIWSNIATHESAGNMLVNPPKNSEGTENQKGDSGKSFEEAKSGNHVPQNSYPRAATDLGSSSCTAALGRFENGRHENGPADLSTAIQTSLHRESSNLMLTNKEMFQQTLNADAAKLENSSDAPNENELACHKTGNGFKSGNGISPTWSESETFCHIPKRSPLHVQREVITRSQPAPVQDSETSASSSLARTTDTVTEVVATEPPHTRMILLRKSREARSHTIQECQRQEFLAYEICEKEDEACFKAEAARLTEELEKAKNEKFVRIESIEETPRIEPERSQRIETKLLKEIEALRSDSSQKCEDLPCITSLQAICEGNIRVIDLEKEVEELNKENEQVNQTIDQVTKSSEGENKIDQVTMAFDGRHMSGPADPNTTVQKSLHRGSSHLMLNNRETCQRNPNADAARLDALDLPITYEMAGSKPYCVSPLPITGNQIKYGKRISATGSDLKSDYHTAQTGPSKLETEPDSLSNKSLSGKPDASHKDRHSDASYEYCAKVIRRLECEGYIETSFRLKFLTWFCLRATPHERKVVSVFVDTLIDDPVSLAAQLADTFSDAIYRKRLQRVPPGFCMELWH